MSFKFSISGIDFVSTTPVIAGSLGGDLGSIPVAVPAAVRLGSGCLEWIPVNGDDAAASWWPKGGKAARALAEFIKLADESDDEKIAQFARRYGVLGITVDGLPACGVREGFPDVPQLEELWHAAKVSWEPIAAYRHYATGAKAMLVLAAALRDAGGKHAVDPERAFSETGLGVDSVATWGTVKNICEGWQMATGLNWEDWWNARNGQRVYMNLSSIDPAQVAHNFDFTTDIYQSLPRDQVPTIQRRKFAFWFTEFWIKRSGLIPTVTWFSEHPQLSLEVGESVESPWVPWPPNSLFRMLVAQLAAVICSGTNSATCSNCGQIYLSDRKIRLDQPHYCDACRPTAASRRTQRSRERGSRNESQN